MNINDYQEKAISTAVYPKDQGLAYLALGLTGEAGEVAEKIKKAIRDTDHVWSRDDLAKELGDVLWYAANLADHIGYGLEEVAQIN